MDELLTEALLCLIELVGSTIVFLGVVGMLLAAVMLYMMARMMIAEDKDKDKDKDRDKGD